jgi:hypothetical protein
MARKIKLAAILAKFSLTSWSPIAFKSLLGISQVRNKAFQTAQPAKKKWRKKKKKNREVFLKLFVMAYMDITIKSANV